MAGELNGHPVESLGCVSFRNRDMTPGVSDQCVAARLLCPVTCRGHLRDHATTEKQSSVLSEEAGNPLFKQFDGPAASVFIRWELCVWAVGQARHPSRKISLSVQVDRACASRPQLSYLARARNLVQGRTSEKHGQIAESEHSKIILCTEQKFSV
jgi:hypothetical protein